MHRDQVRLLEEELETAIAQVVRRVAKDGGVKSPPLGRTYHLMAKAAVAVLEAVADEEER
jgi:hypothetical protein